ncbi:PREDICTED: fibrous sheath CABYR-binding protein [Rhagoletis zephyria]|uniref:fibrous sheath CABYR-binding protein n=1 Tax=Rhagoletis zephyria TaxID=28612 RepID=UPI000811451C|nr:PREDICTED: fibrous sheath CABYR-binding protein [Rhagoletis zephyria]
MRKEIMWKHTLMLVCLSGCCLAGPLHGVKRNVPIVLREEEAEVERPAPEPLAPEYPDMPSTLTLPSNATSIRADITDNFSCDDKVYGYYADVENECQIFHVCLPVTYADGKENTFRWSFICPEETVFSQDSFTCMRREDMAITCEESVNYYELNRNFGMSEDQNANSNNVRPSAEQAEAATPAESVEPAQQNVQQAAAPQEPTQAAAAPAPPQPKPVKEKPIKVQKPNRRKPQTKPQQDHAIHPTNKLPVIMPLRKMPNVGAKVPVSVPAEVVAIHEVADELKPVPPRYKKRPAVSYNSDKEVVETPAQPFKIEVIHTASNPESFKRKRPTFAHKQNAVVTKVAEQAPVVTIVPEAEAVETIVPLVKFESNSAAVPAPEKVETITISEPVAQAAEDTPVVVVKPAQVALDAEPQASETEEVIVAPENALKTIVAQQTVPLKEEQQTQVAAVAPTEIAESVPAEESVNIVPIVEETIKTEEPVAPVAEEETKVEEPAVAEVAQFVETEKQETAAAPVEAIEEIPAVVSEAVESAPEVEKIEEVANPPVEAEPPALPVQPAEPADQLTGASEPIALDAAPELVAPNEDNEEYVPALPSLEELEEQKPANAVETVAATPEMEQQDPIVEQAFDSKDTHLQTVGGFKPVDPELAAEAEALISDFINTLKSGNPNAIPDLAAPTEEDSPAEGEDAKVEIGEQQQTEEKIEKTETKPEEALSAQEADTSSLKTVSAEQPVAAAIENVPLVAESAPVIETEEQKDSPLLNFPISNSFPADMYQIPVTVIQTPYEEIQDIQSDVQEPQQSSVEEVKADGAQFEAQAQAEEEKQEGVKLLPEETAITQAETAITEEQKVEDIPAVEAQPEAVQLAVQEAQPEEAVEPQPDTVQPTLPELVESEPEAELPAAPVAFRPISIDDIVELVKERLDQVPADEKGAPMELLMEPDNADKPVELKLSSENGSAAQEESAEQTPAEDIIFPIYHRVSEPESSDIKAQEAIAVDEPIAVVTDLKALPLETDAVQNAPEAVVQTADQAVQTDAEKLEANVAKTAENTETETNIAPADDVKEPVNAVAVEVAAADAPVDIETAEVTKANRSLRSRSLTKAKLDPRKRRFLFRSDAS